MNEMIRRFFLSDWTPVCFTALSVPLLIINNNGAAAYMAGLATFFALRYALRNHEPGSDE